MKSRGRNEKYMVGLRKNEKVYTAKKPQASLATGVTKARFLDWSDVNGTTYKAANENGYNDNIGAKNLYFYIIYVLYIEFYVDL